MTWEELSNKLISLGLKPSDFPHGSNLATKTQGQLSAPQQAALTKVVPAYLTLYEMTRRYESSQVELDELLNKTEAYYDLLRSPEANCFTPQSDFVSSVLPELLCILLRRAVSELPSNNGLIVTAQKNIVIECNFDIADGGRIIAKRKRVDVAILSQGSLSFNNEKIEFEIPAMCAEIKTNIDKNMLSGIESSVETLKRTFPRTKYYAICEYSDFEIKSQNYASTGIDEIMIVRNQKRSAVRRSLNSRNLISKELISSFLDDIKHHLKTTARAHPNLASRLSSGRLII